MNRSFRAQQSQMQASAKQRQHVESTRSSMMKEKEEELALFLDMRKREKELTNLLLQTSEEFDAPSGLKPGTSPIFNITSSTPARKTGTDDFLNSDTDKNDYDWLLTPPTTPLFPSLEMESRRTVMSQIGTPKACPTSLKSRLANPQQESSSRCNSSSRQSASSLGLNSSNAGIRRPSSPGCPGARPETPTGRTTLTSSAKPTLTTAPKSMPTTFSNSISTSMPKPSRSSTLTSRATLTSTRSTAPPRSTTPLSGASARSSTPTSRPILPASSKPASRAPTPPRRQATPSTMSNASAPPVKSRPSSVTRSCPMDTGRNPVAPQRARSPIVKSGPWKPLEIPDFSLDAPPNLRTSLPDRPHSATRGRPGAPSSRSSSVEPVSNGRVRRQSCSPSRGRAPNGNIHNSGGSVPVANRLHAKANDNVSPVLIGTNMVDRVMNMRKLVPPKQDDKHSPLSNLSGKSSSPDSAGFGRTLSKKSLDMAMRHMDIRRHIPGSLRPLMTNIPASSMYSVRSGPTRSRTISVSDSPLATSSNASSEVSVNNNGLCVVDGREFDDDDISSDKGRHRPPANVRCR